jgi:hypothetical protein
MNKFHEKNPSNVYEKFHGEFHGIPWNSKEFYRIFHGIFSMEFQFHETKVDGIPWKIPWKIREFVNSRNFMGFGFDRKGSLALSEEEVFGSKYTFL